MAIKYVDVWGNEYATKQDAMVEALLHIDDNDLVDGLAEQLTEFDLLEWILIDGGSLVKDKFLKDYSIAVSRTRKELAKQLFDTVIVED